MIIPHHMSGKTVAILGLGRSGISVCDALLMAGAICYVHDDQMIPDHTPQEAIIAAPDQWPWDDIDALVMSPGIPTRYPAPHPVAEQAQARQIPIISDIELFMNADIAARVIGITGTNGKSTTTALVAHIINQCGIPTITGGNIGTPVMALNDPGADGIIVLELSSYQLEISPS
ncbi:MAG: Mur ligase family protein, partial [Candidatus Puniceispirillales bacterium]